MKHVKRSGKRDQLAEIGETVRGQPNAGFARRTMFNEAFTLVPAATGSSGLRRRYQQPLTAIMVVVALVLLIACANIANLLLARANARRHELSVRIALGASKVRIARQLLTESLLLSGVGALVGLLFARWGSGLLVRQLSSTTNTVFLDLGLDWRMLGFTALIAITTAILFGVAPALRASRVQPNEALKEQGRGVVGERFGLGNLLVVIQVALSVILVVAAGLFVRTFSSLANVHLGFDHRPVLIANINAQRLQLDPSQRPELFERLRQAAANLPGVTSAALSAVTPVSGSTWNNVVEIPGAPARPERERMTNINLLSSSWFQTMGTRLIAGRDFTDRDATGSAPVATRSGDACPGSAGAVAHRRDGRLDSRAPRSAHRAGACAQGRLNTDASKVVCPGARLRGVSQSAPRLPSAGLQSPLDRAAVRSHWSPRTECRAPGYLPASIRSRRRLRSSNGMLPLLSIVIQPL